MRYRDQPTLEVTERVHCDVQTAWDLVTDIELPVRCSAELQAVQWLGDADRVQIGARFKGANQNEAIGTWEVECEVVEVEDQGDVRRWVWNVLAGDGVGASWGFEVEPATDGVLVRQWGRIGPAPTGLSMAIAARPELEGRILTRRLGDWEQGMRANLAYIKAQAEG